MSLLILHGEVVTVNAERDVYPGGYVWVGDDGRIRDVGPAGTAPATHAAQVVDATGMLVLPGLVNAFHEPWQHLAMGLDDNASGRLAGIAAALDADALRAAAELSAAELIAGGTTCVLHRLPGAPSAQAQAAAIEPLAAAGLRQFAALDVSRIGEAAARDALARWHGAAGGRVHLAVHAETALRAVAAGRVREHDIAAAWAFAVAHDLRMLTETDVDDDALPAFEAALRRTGRSGVTHLMELGLLDSRWLLAHAHRLTDTDLALMHESGCHAVAAPLYEAFHGQGPAIWTRLQRAGIGCALGTVGTAATCSSDLVEQMKAMVLVQNTVRLDPTAMSAETAIEMATLGGARALGLADEIGSLAPGKRADVAVFDLRSPHLQVAHKPLSNFVCCGRGRDAHLVLVDGRVVHGLGVAAPEAADLLARARRAAQAFAAPVERAIA